VLLPRANATRIAVLEHDLLGVSPAPGTAAAVALALRRAGTCFEHQPVDVTTWSDEPGRQMLCTGCGNYVLPTDDGRWQVVRQPVPESDRASDLH
jgi:hypothetical protein